MMVTIAYKMQIGMLVFPIYEDTLEHRNIREEDDLYSTQ